MGFSLPVADPGIFLGGDDRLFLGELLCKQLPIRGPWPSKPNR